jgi:putative acetyltransferase
VKRLRELRTRNDDVHITPGDFSNSRVIELLRIHVASARAQTAPGSAHALDLAGLQSPDIRFWTIWDGNMLVGFGALKRLAPDHGEVKSMHTVESLRGRGVGTAMLRHIIAAARGSGFVRLSLETGSWAYFQPAQALYRKHGFVECPPFADYGPDPNSVFMTLELQARTGPAGFSMPGQ